MASSVSSAGTSIGRRAPGGTGPGFSQPLKCVSNRPRSQMQITNLGHVDSTDVAEGEPEKTFRVMPGGIRTVGRATGADFIVDAPLVSRVHCRLTALPDGGLEVHDLDSTNGTCFSTASACRRRGCRRATGSASAGSSSSRCATPTRTASVELQSIETSRPARRSPLLFPAPSARQDLIVGRHLAVCGVQVLRRTSPQLASAY